MTLSVTRKQDRFAMVNAIRDLWLEFPSIKMEMSGPNECLQLDFQGPRGVALTVELDAKDRQNKRGVWVLSWHSSWNSREDFKFSPIFGEPNTIHWMKSTDVVYSFRQLLETLKARFAMLEDGSAFQL